MDDARREVPRITEGMREVAWANPGQWVYVIDPDFDPDGAVPAWGIEGAFPTNRAGQILRDGYRPNGKYRPGPRRRGFPVPVNQVERALELAVAEYGPTSDLLVALRQATLVIPALRGARGQIPIVTDSEGRSLLMAFTSTERVTAGAAAGGPPRELEVRRLADVLRRVRVRLNPGSPPSLTLDGPEILDG